MLENYFDNRISENWISKIGMLENYSNIKMWRNNKERWVMVILMCKISPRVQSDN